jgi:hypothetical protein
MRRHQEPARPILLFVGSMLPLRRSRRHHSAQFGGTALRAAQRCT